MNYYQFIYDTKNNALFNFVMQVKFLGETVKVLLTLISDSAKFCVSQRMKHNQKWGLYTDNQVRGKHNIAFEEEFKEWNGNQHAVFTNDA